MPHYPLTTAPPLSGLRRVLLALSAAALPLAISACQPVEADASGSTQTPTAAAGTKLKLTAAEALDRLTVAPENRTGYDRDLFPLWADVDGNGCDTRREVLITEVRVDDAHLGPGCDITDGEWFSYYDQQTTSDDSTFDIDHLVPLAEAWDSGASQWNRARRQAYANDIGDTRSLIAVTASSNRTKSDADPTQWLPQYKKCTYVNSWIAVKLRWSLSVDDAEMSKLRDIVSGCNNKRLSVRIAKVTSDGGGSTADARPSDDERLLPAGSSEHAKDPRFASCAAANDAGYGPYRKGQNPEYGWYVDGDRDGTTCEPYQ